MSFVYPNEQARRSCGLVTLDNIFSAHTDDLPPQLMVADDSSPDGHLLGPHQAAYCIVDFKNKLVDFSAIPYVEIEMTSIFPRQPGKQQCSLLR